MKSRTITLDLADEAATNRLGQDIANAVKRGDLIALSGKLGAGKTTLARAMIRSLAGDHALEVPSPTYTLAQAYDAQTPITHFDLYRIADTSELDDLGLYEALDDGAAIVEWPENAADALPAAAFAIALSDAGNGGRTAIVQTTPAAEARLRRSFETRQFLHEAGWGDAARAPLIGDASTRRYEIATPLTGPARLVMDAPEQPDGPPIRDGKPYSRIARLSESVEPFVAIDHALREHGFCAPEIYAADLKAGYLLIEDLGSEGVIDADRRPIPERFEAAIDLLSRAHCCAWPTDIDAPFGAVHRIPPYDREAMLIEVELLLDWYMPVVTGRQPDEGDRAAFAEAWNSAIDHLDDAETTMVMRDFHSPNLIWRGDRSGTDRLGIIDFQDALIGPSAYDVASLAQDARIPLAQGLEQSLVERYCRMRGETGGFDEASFRKTYAIMSVQRCSKILGIFVRLDRRDGKPAYLKHLPHMRDYLRRSIDHEALTPVRELYQRWQLLDEAGT